MIYLLKYDKRRGVLLSILEFGENEAQIAEESRLNFELQTMGAGGNVEIVLLEAESEEALRRTHARYFESLADLSKPADEM